MNWLKKARNEASLTQKQLSEITGINKYTIENIEQGKRRGDSKTVNKLKDYFKNKLGIDSYDSEKLIVEIKNDILEIGEDTFMYAMFEIIDNKIFLTNYDFITEEEPLTEKEKSEFALIIEMKAKDILQILEIQNKIFKK